ncbi:monocarboxylate transporter 7-like [Cheilinus undulatus]|uniref:monocarboxylate transporter 7-like n=1 Tax=Cheilinus undulatus TaxID=241271 RepID=UPI001BD46C92|nr:monocarboxylate transporter 7-like [Cheilinus undulatus]
MALCGVKGPRFLGPNVYPEAPDGGWGWVVAVAFFLVEVCTYGIIKSFGIFLQDLMEEFGETNNRVSWIVSICVFVMTFNAPLSAVMTNRFGFQLVVMLGGLLISTGTIATSFTSSINQMYITYGLIAGIGYCLTFLPTLTMLSQYFNQRRSLVTGVASTGESLSMFALAPAFSALRDRIGWRRTMAVIGAMQSILIICGALLRPIIIKPKSTYKGETDASSPKELEALSAQEKTEGTNPDDTSNAQMNSYSQENELTTGSVSTGDSGVQSLKDTEGSNPEEKILLQKEAAASENSVRERELEEENSKDAEKEVSGEEKKQGEKLITKKTKLLDFSILKECSFILYSLFGLFVTLGFFAPQLYIIELSVSRGVERERAAYMLSIMAVAEIFGRFSIGWILSRNQLRTKKLLVLLVCVILMATDLVGFTLVTEFYGLAVCCAVYGFFMGTLACTHIPMLAEDDVVGIERMSSAAGVYVFIQSFAGLAGPPLGGVLVDVTQNYGSAFYSCAAGIAISAVFLGLVRPAKRGLLCRRRNSKQSDIKQETKKDSEEKGAARKPDKRTDSAEDCTEIDNISMHDQEEATKDDQEVISFA